jgi:hypothetical protein
MQTLLFSYPTLVFKREIDRLKHRNFDVFAALLPPLALLCCLLCCLLRSSLLALLHLACNLPWRGRAKRSGRWITASEQEEA